MTATYVWAGPCVSRTAFGSIYHGLIRELDGVSVEYRVGDAVLLESGSSSKLPFVAILDRFWEDNAGEMMLNARWFYRPMDVPSDIKMPAAPRNALFLSNQVRLRVRGFPNFYPALYPFPGLPAGFSATI